MADPLSAEYLAAVENLAQRILSTTPEDRVRALATIHLSNLLDEIRRLQHENHLLHLSRGSAPLVGRD